MFSPAILLIAFSITSKMDNLRPLLCLEYLFSTKNIYCMHRKASGCIKKASGSAFFNMVTQNLGPLMFYMSKGKKGEASCRDVAEKPDVLGLNYAASRYEDDCKNYLDCLMVGSETIIGELQMGSRSVYPHHTDRCGRHLEAVYQRSGSCGNRRPGHFAGPWQCCNADGGKPPR